MVEHLRITVLTENTAGQAGVLAEHGLSIWLEADSRRVLFDTGQGLALLANARALGIDLAETTEVVLSHGHYDHVGGLPRALGQLSRARVFVHPAALGKRYGRGGPDQPVRELGGSLQSVDELRPLVADVQLTSGPTEVAPGVHATGPVPRQTNFEDAGGTFFCDEACTQPDDVPDDQSLYVETPRGVVVCTGCAHAGLVNTLDYVAQLTGQAQIYAVFGGAHLTRASDERIERTMQALDRYGVQLLGPAHCTGLRAVSQALRRWPDRLVSFSAGSVVTVC